MPAYCFFDNVQITDQARMEQYKSRVLPIVQQYGGRYVVIGGQCDVVEGHWRPTFPVIIEFPSLAHAHRWYESEEYREVKGLRVAAGRFNAVFIEGL